MREIKFRGKNYLRPSTWVHGNLVIYGNKPSIQDYSVSNGEIFQVKPETIGQYIGRKDKNSNEIYENCILNIKIYDHNYPDKVIVEANEKVEYRGCTFGVLWGWHREFTSLDAFANNVIFEILGNVFDNPELLEDKTNDKHD